MSIASVSTALIQAAPAADGSGGGAAGAIIQFFPFIAIFAIFYLLLIRPQQRRVKEHQATISAVQKGDEVVTAGGIRGRVTKVNDGEVEVEIAQGVKVRVVKSTLSQVGSTATKPAND